MANTIIGSDLEVKVYNWLLKKSYRENIDFAFQTQLIGIRGVRELGDAIADFLIFKQRLVWRVQGEYWHVGAIEEARDTIQKQRLEGLGYTVIDLWERDLTNRLNFTLNKAIEGEQLVKYGN